MTQKPLLRSADPGWHDDSVFSLQVDGRMESWVTDLASALKSTLGDVNVVICDWLTLAHRHYPAAAQNTRAAGRDVAHLLQWLEFVDAIHTFTQQHLGLSMGIAQPVGHFDFYPNGGAFQPGCEISTLFSHLSQYGLGGFQKSVKCSHERAVHLFIDSLLNRDERSTGFWCREESAFDRGVCLDCRKNRCNRLGYDIKRVQTKTSKKLYLKTRSNQPYKVYHYQLKLQFINQVETIKPFLTISLTGTKAESVKLPLTFVDGISGNRTHTFLVTLDTDIGELMMLKLHWEGRAVLASVWNRMQTFIPWGGERKRRGLTLGNMRIKTGDTQAKTSFCAKTNDEMYLQPSQEKIFVRCQAGRLKQQRRRIHS
ncbi:hypothetical protein COCON_G00112410 [Conger conger]|uniref:Hepatic triacylglycerol lipase n=1 Tax=Conger conger TaxID=82655 RepID=A0A9Q1I0C2_CONCO|nr:hypothetical protein COCON_G00112410 [Conger conger]